MTFSILAIFTVQSEFISQFRDALMKNASASQQEPGCISYIVHGDASASNVFFLYEKYQSKEDYEFHRTTSHLKEFREVMTPMLESDPVIYRGSEI
jgi:quinol monooxygenase YgiN